MGPEIAAILGRGGCSSTLSEPGTVVVYRQQGCSFEPVREMTFALDQDKGLKELRAKMAELIEFLNGCKIFVARSASGALYFELEKAGFSVWEISGKPADFLAIILEDEEKKRAAAQVVGITGIPAPPSVLRAVSSYRSKRFREDPRPSAASRYFSNLSVKENSGNWKLSATMCPHGSRWMPSARDLPCGRKNSGPMSAVSG
jgi:hypothetical protein